MYNTTLHDIAVLQMFRGAQITMKLQNMIAAKWLYAKTCSRSLHSDCLSGVSCLYSLGLCAKWELLLTWNFKVQHLIDCCYLPSVFCFLYVIAVSLTVIGLFYKHIFESKNCDNYNLCLNSCSGGFSFVTKNNMSYCMCSSDTLFEAGIDIMLCETMILWYKINVLWIHLAM